MYFLPFKEITKNMLMSTMIHFEIRMEKVGVIKEVTGEKPPDKSPPVKS